MSTITDTVPAVNIEITYNRSTRRYEWADPVNGTLFTAPSGSKNKAALFQAVVGMLDPDLFNAAQRMIENNPHIERDVWKGVEVVINDGVEVFPIPINSAHAMIDSSDGYGRYAIIHYERRGLTCQCEHWQSMAAPMLKNGRRVCKHIIAMYLWKYTREDRY